MREDKFLPIEPALQMKEIGFDEQCLAVFYHKGDLTEFYMYHKKFFHTLNVCKNSELTEKFPNYLATPLYQDAFEWFRDEHGLEGKVERAEDYTWYKWEVTRYNENGKKYVADYYEYETYREAENDCLHCLINEVKNYTKRI